MDEILKQTLLYDFYGELLTAHQKEIYEQVVLEDYSLSEVAEAAGIRRQGVHDLVKRGSKTLEGYEGRRERGELFMSVKQKVHEINTRLEDYGNQDTEELMARIRELSSEIIEEL